ncbi:synthase gamma chain [Seminavis robusta]|uniref:ATP synthase subunit gamma n=1 Tax=Seminavis robusta TaxID=568900 RepID=A0A9N8DPE9_9STRA|nr:synthase gamma chain [Seminavis robusta]|eukprot:Sro263_g102270.1 synthase gamma chain (295) ;mRNA; r:39652-41210
MAPTLMAARRVAPRAFGTATQQVRGMATEKQIFNQINATKNIQKITSSMKMVSAAKLKGDETRLTKAIPFNQWSFALCPEPVEVEDATCPYDDLPQKSLLVPFTSDKGLCGGINSFISRATRECVKKLHAAGKEADVVVIGDKGRGQMRRFVPDQIVRSATEVVAPGTFSLASALAAELMAAGAMEYDAVVLIYNSYVNAAVYKQKYKIVPPFVFEGESEVSLSTYDFDSDKDEAMADLYEFMLASQIFHSFMDGAAAEQSSRMTAMENASKNAGEMIDSLTLRGLANNHNRVW